MGVLGKNLGVTALEIHHHDSKWLTILIKIYYVIQMYSKKNLIFNSIHSKSAFTFDMEVFTSILLACA